MRRRGFSIIELSLVLAIVALFAGVAWTTLQTSQETSNQEIARMRLALLEVELTTLKNQAGWQGAYPSSTFARVSVGGASLTGGGGGVVGSTGTNVISVHPLAGDPSWVVGTLLYEQDGGSGCLIVLVGPDISRWGYDPQVNPELVESGGGGSGSVQCRATNPAITTQSVTGTLTVPNVVNLQP